MFDGLQDLAFGVAPGRWSMVRCTECETAYLDPRPDSNSIGRAYERYYTHQLDNSLPFWKQTGMLARMKIDYLNRNYGYRFPGGLPFGGWALERMHKAFRVDFAIRHLPAPVTGLIRLLDVGCGDGLFVRLANQLGFDAKGIDPDPSAIADGRAHGLDLVSGIFPDPSFTDGGFHHVTMNHVLEHLHQPREAIAQIFDILAPGGRLWLSNPNLDALGLHRFGPTWRGLEVPRHLSLYNEHGARLLLERAGFVNITHLPPEEEARFYFTQSSAMANGRDPYATQNEAPDKTLLAQADDATRQARKQPNVAESLTMIAFKPL